MSKESIIKFPYGTAKAVSVKLGLSSHYVRRVLNDKIVYKHFNSAGAATRKKIFKEAEKHAKSVEADKLKIEVKTRKQPVLKTLKAPAIDYPHGTGAAVAKTLGLTDRYVRAVLSGSYSNTPLTQRAIATHKKIFEAAKQHVKRVNQQKEAKASGANPYFKGAGKAIAQQLKLNPKHVNRVLNGTLTDFKTPKGRETAQKIFEAAKPFKRR
jgi:hypothetical protein